MGLLDNARYPQTWDEFIGQDLAKEMLQDAALTAVVNGEPADHILLASGQEGIGKTALAKLFAQEMGAGIEFVGGEDLTQDKARIKLFCMQDGDVLVIEEIHRMGKRKSEWLLNYLQDGVMMGPFGAEEMPKVTIVATTTEEGALLPTVTSRFMVPPLVAYTTEKAAQIVARRAQYRMVEKGLDMPSPANCEAIAEAASRNPRRIDRLIKLLRNMVTSGKIVYEDGYDLSQLFTAQGMTADGLDRIAQQYLVALFTTFDGLVGQSTIAKYLRAPGGLAETEYLLQDKDLIMLTARGRRLTHAGMERARDLAREAA